MVGGTQAVREGGPSGSPVPGDVLLALTDVDLPTYAIDRFGVIRWLNPAATALVGDARGRQFTSVVAPEDTRAAREAFARKVLGKERSTDAAAELLDPQGKRVEVEISSAPLRDGGRVVGVFGIIRSHVRTAAVGNDHHPHLTPRQVRVLELLAHGRSTAQIAEELKLAVPTVRNHVKHLLRALGVHSRLEAVATARREGLLRP